MSATMLTIIGLTVTIVLGLWSIYLMVKRKYPGEITFVRESCVGLFDSIVKNMPELVVQYKGLPVGKEIVLLKGAFLNTGSQDISESMVEEKISISLPDKFRWLTAKVVSTLPKVQAQLKIKAIDRSIVFETGLFRCHEYVRFEALVEVPVEDSQDNKREGSIEKRLIKALKINYRIADTQKIKSKDLEPSYDSPKQPKISFVVPGVLVVVGVVLILLLCFKGFPQKIHFLIPLGDGRTIEVNAKPRANGMLSVEGIQDKSYSKTVPAQQFLETSGIVAKIVPDTFFKVLVFPIMILSLLIPLFLIVIMYREQYQNKRLKELLNIHK